MDKKILQEVGLSQKEIEIYLTLLRAENLTASKIAEKTGIYRPNVYDNLESLIEKGLVSFVISDRVKHFRAEKPEKLEEYLLEKHETLHKIIPELNQMIAQKTDETSVTVHRGKHVLRTVLTNNLNLLKKHGGIHYAMNVDDARYVENEPIYFHQFIKLIEESGINERMISPLGSKFFAGGKTSEYKFIPEEFFSPISTHIAYDTVSIITWSHPLYAVVIKNKEVANSYTKHFNLLWKIAKKGQWRKYLPKKK